MFLFLAWGKKFKSVLVTIGILLCLVNRLVWATVKMSHLSHNVAEKNFWRISPCDISGEFWKILIVIIGKLLFTGKLTKLLMKSISVSVSEIISWRFLLVPRNEYSWRLSSWKADWLKIHSGEMLTFFSHLSTLMNIIISYFPLNFGERRFWKLLFSFKMFPLPVVANCDKTSFLFW